MARCVKLVFCCIIMGRPLLHTIHNGRYVSNDTFEVKSIGINQVLWLIDGSSFSLQSQYFNNVGLCVHHIQSTNQRANYCCHCHIYSQPTAPIPHSEMLPWNATNWSSVRIRRILQVFLSNSWCPYSPQATNHTNHHELINSRIHEDSWGFLTDS